MNPSDIKKELERIWREDSCRCPGHRLGFKIFKRNQVTLLSRIKGSRYPEVRRKVKHGKST